MSVAVVLEDFGNALLAASGVLALVGVIFFAGWMFGYRAGLHEGR